LSALYGVITNDVSDYINLLVRIAHIICNHPLHWKNKRDFDVGFVCKQGWNQWWIFSSAFQVSRNKIHVASTSKNLVCLIYSLETATLRLEQFH